MKTTARLSKPTRAFDALLLALLLVPTAQRLAGSTLVSSLTDLQGAVSTASAGATIYLANGNYSLSGTVPLNNTAGTKTNPITIAAQTPGNVLITGHGGFVLGNTSTVSANYLIFTGFRFDSATNGSATSSAPIIAIEDAFNCEVTNCAFINSGDTTTSTGGGSGGGTAGATDAVISIRDGSQFTRIDHNYFQGLYSQAINIIATTTPVGGNGGTKTWSAGPWQWIDHNYFNAIGRLSANGQEPIQIGQVQNVLGTVASEVMVEWNLWNDATGDSELFSNKSSSNWYRYNTFENSLNNAGLSLRGGEDCIVEGNFVLSTSTGITLAGTDHVIVNNFIANTQNPYATGTSGAINLAVGSGEASTANVQAPTRILIANNTLYPLSGTTTIGSGTGSTGGVVLGAGFSPANPALPSSNYFFNNLITSTAGTLISDLASTGNTWFGNYISAAGTATTGYAASGIVTTVSPTFDSQSPVPHLTMGQAINTDADVDHTSGYIPAEDMDGQTRSTSTAVGADQYTSSSPTVLPLTATDVGPTWMGFSQVLPASNMIWGPSSISTAIASESTAVVLAWASDSTTSLGYQVRYRTADGPWNIPTTSIAGVSTTSAVIDNLTPNQIYSFQVRGLGTSTNGADGSAWSPPIKVVTPGGYEESSTDTWVEAESYSQIYSTSFGAWTSTTSSLTATAGTYGGTSYMGASSTSGIPTWTNSPGMDYDILFHTGGTYYAYARCYATDSGSDSIFWGVNDVVDPSTATFGAGFTAYGQWTWVALGSFYVTNTSSLTTINLRRREHNTLVDRLLFSTTTADVPTTTMAGELQSGFLVRPLITGFSGGDSNVGAGGARTMSVTIDSEGDPAPSYQWQSVVYGTGTSSNATLTPISGATSSSYAATSSGYYTVVASNLVGTSAAPIVNLGVVAPPSFTVQPTASSPTDVGDTITLTAYANASTGVTAQWFKGTTSLSSAGVPVGTSSSFSYQITEATQADSGTYSVVLSSSEGAATSSGVSVNITSIPVMPIGGTAVFEAKSYNSVSQGDQPPFSTWTQSSDGTTTYMQASGPFSISGWTQTTVGGTTTYAGPGMNYLINVPDTATTYTVWVRALAANTGSDTLHWGVNQTESGQSPVTIPVITPTASFVWQKLGTVSMAVGQQELEIRRREGFLEIEQFYLTTGTQSPTVAMMDSTEPAPTINVQPTSTVSAYNGSASFAVSASGATAYQWFRSGPSATPLNWSGVTGTHSATLSITAIKDLPPMSGVPNHQPGAEGTYFVRVYNPFGHTDSNLVNLMVANRTFGQPTSQTVSPGASVLFSITPDSWIDGSNNMITPQLQWLANGIPVSTQTGAAYFIPTATTGMNGNTYSVQETLTTSTGTISITSKTATLSVP